MKFPEGIKYTTDHEWVRLDGDVVTIGVTDFAQDALGDVVYVDLPDVGDTLAAGDTVAEIESVKAVSDIFSPVSGEVVAVNEDLDGAEEAVNEDPYGAGWLFQVRLSDMGELDGMMDIEGYKAFVAEQDA